MRHHFFIKIIFLCLVFCQAYANSTHLSLDLQDVNLPQALRILAKFLHKNVMISPSVTGTVSLHLHQINEQAVFDLLLQSHKLAKKKIGNIWFIASQDELIQQREQFLKWQEMVNASSPLITKIWQIRYSKAADIVNLLKAEHSSLISKRGKILFDERTNIICIQDISEKIATLDFLIQRLDVPVQQILIEARLVSIDSDYERELGFDFVVQHQKSEAKRGSVTSHSSSESEGFTVAVVKLANDSLLDVKLSALEKDGHAELISNPTLFTGNQQPASIEAGEEVPYQELTESGGTAVVFKKAVLGLKVTPQILPTHKVLLHLQINQDRPSKRMVLGVPTISTRQIISHVLLRSGETIVLGGIYESNQEQGVKRIPFIGELPFIGALFSLQNMRENRRELLIFVTPKIISS